jgi:hypothetical protein
MIVLGFEVEYLGNEEFDYNYKLTDGSKTIYLIRSLGKLLPVSETGKCGQLKGVRHFTDSDGILTPIK